MLRCVLFDRDGTLGALADNRYPATFSPFCDIADVFARIKARGYTVGIVTNQSSVARGTGKGYDFDAEFAAYGADVWKICPHDTADGCDCRKPKSGLLLAAAKELGLAPCECLLVGDRMSDVLCAKNAGAQAALVLTGNGEAEREEILKKYPDLPVLQRFDGIVERLKKYAKRS